MKTYSLPIRKAVLVGDSLSSSVTRPQVQTLFSCSHPPVCGGGEARRQGDVSSFIAKALWLLFVALVFFLFFWIMLLFSLSFLAGVVIHRNWGYAHSQSCFTSQCFASAKLNSASLPYSFPNISLPNIRHLMRCLIPKQFLNCELKCIYWLE